MYFVAAGLATIQQHMTDGSPKSGLPVDLVGTLSDGCEPYFAFLALKKLGAWAAAEDAAAPTSSANALSATRSGAMRATWQPAASLVKCAPAVRPPRDDAHC